MDVGFIGLGIMGSRQAANLRRAGGPDAKGDAFTEYEMLLDLGVDGIFSDYTDTAVQARDWWQQRQSA